MPGSKSSDYHSPCPGLDKKVSGHRHSKHCKQRIIVIAKQREFNEEAWVRLLKAYAYALYDKRKREGEPHKGVGSQGFE